MLTEEDVVDVGQAAGFDGEEVRSHISNQDNLNDVYQAALKWSSRGTDGMFRRMEVGGLGVWECGGMGVSG